MRSGGGAERRADPMPGTTTLSPMRAPSGVRGDAGDNQMAVVGVVEVAPPASTATPRWAVSKSDMPWLVPLCLLALLALLTGVFLASVRNARALRRDLEHRFGAVQAGLERHANRITDELLARTNDSGD
jgi:hypothetical protein